MRSSSTNATYTALLKFLYNANRTHSVKMELGKLRVIDRVLGSPLATLPRVVHVAGTNGKGSVSWKVAAALSASGLRTGLFVSPHVTSYRERMRVDGELISEDAVATLLPTIVAACESCRVQPSFFELTTLLAAMHFRRAAVDAVVLEVGLGGRLDSTNLCNPALAVITSIDIDHARILGGTRDEIAVEKAGIIKRGVDVVVGPHVPRGVVAERAASLDAPAHWVERDPVSALTGIEETYDHENMRVARAAWRALSGALPRDAATFAALDRDDSRLEAALASRPPCRFEELVPSAACVDAMVQDARGGSSETAKSATFLASSPPPRVVLDAAHNPAGLRRMLNMAAVRYPHAQLRVVAGFSQDKSVDECLRILLDEVPPHRIHLCSASHRRAAPVAHLAARLRAISSGHGLSGGGGGLNGGGVDGNRPDAGSITSATEAALREAWGEPEVVVIVGSLFIMAEARECLGIIEPRDEVQKER